MCVISSLLYANVICLFVFFFVFWKRDQIFKNWNKYTLRLKKNCVYHLLKIPSNIFNKNIIRKHWFLGLINWKTIIFWKYYRHIPIKMMILMITVHCLNKNVMKIRQILLLILYCFCYFRVLKSLFVKKKNKPGNFLINLW